MFNPKAFENTKAHGVSVMKIDEFRESPRWEAADWAVKQFLGDLTEKDTFALGLFHNSTK